LSGQGAEVVVRVQDPAGELVGGAQSDGGDEVGGGLRVSPSPLGGFAEAGQPGMALLSPGQLLGHRGTHEPGMHAEHADLRPGQFAGQRLGQPGDAGLGDGECRDVALLPVAEIAVDRDNPAAASRQPPASG
jgi:hypothetical protein